MQISRRRRLLFLALILAAAAGFAEVAGAVLYFVTLAEPLQEAVELALGTGSTWAPGSAARYRRHPYLNYVGDPEFALPDGTALFNPHGFRDTGVDWLGERAGDGVRLVAIGGSTTFGFLFEDADQVWPSLLARRLREATGRPVEALNAGLPGYTTHNLLAFCGFWLPELGADAVVVHTGFNDAFATVFPDEGGPTGDRFHRPFALRPVPGPLQAVLRRSYLARMLSLGWLERRGYLGGDLVPATIQPRPPEPELVRFAGAASGRYFERNLGTIVRLIRAAGAVPVIATIPMDPERERKSGSYYGAAFDAARRNNRLAAAVAAQHGVAFVDLYAEVRDPAGFVDPIHVNQAGMRAKADALFPVLLPLLGGGGPKPSP